MHLELVEYSNDIHTDYIFTVQNLYKHFINEQYRVTVTFYDDVEFLIINTESKISIYFQNE